MTNIVVCEVIRPPPPAYTEALSYPKDITTPSKGSAPTVISSAHVKWAPDLCHHHQNELDTCSVYTEPIYQTLPGEKVYVYHPGHLYSNIGPAKFANAKFTYTIKETSEGKPVIYLEPFSENLASLNENMGVKTYAQLEVVAAGNHGGGREGEVVCGVPGVTGVTGCPTDVHKNGKAVLVPVNGIVNPDKLIVDSLLSDRTLTESLNGEARANTRVCDRELNNGDTRHGSDTDLSEIDGAASPTERQTQRDVQSLTQALDEEDKNSTLGEHTPLLQSEPAQSNTVDERVKFTDETSNHSKSDNHSGSGQARYKSSAPECCRLEFKEHVTEHSTDHVLEHAIYSEPEYSSSDISISKCDSDTAAPKQNLETCQKTLKRTYNGVDTVYELSPSDSFYNSADNVRSTGKDQTSVASSEGLCRLGHSSSSLTDSRTQQRTRHPLNRDTSVSFKKPLVVGPSGVCSTSLTEVQPKDSVVVATDAEPLVTSTPTTKPSDSTEAIPAHLVLEDTRSYYRRKAADRGSLYCAAAGILIVATIVFLLIYFS